MNDISSGRCFFSLTHLISTLCPFPLRPAWRASCALMPLLTWPKPDVEISNLSVHTHLPGSHVNVETFWELPPLANINSPTISSHSTYISLCNSDGFFMIIHSVFVLFSTHGSERVCLFYCYNSSTTAPGLCSVHVCGMSDGQDLNLSYSSQCSRL